MTSITIPAAQDTCVHKFISCQQPQKMTSNLLKKAHHLYDGGAFAKHLTRYFEIMFSNSTSHAN